MAFIEFLSKLSFASRPCMISFFLINILMRCITKGKPHFVVHLQCALMSMCADSRAIRQMGWVAGWGIDKGGEKKESDLRNGRDLTEALYHVMFVKGE